jgi:hypothetical protein
VDDGQTRPKLNSAGLSWLSGSTLSADIVPLTSGSGNVKGVSCLSDDNTELATSSVQIYVNGGSAQNLNLSDAIILQDNALNYYTGYIPLNVRFGTSIKVTMMRPSSAASLTCSVSWALD